LAIKLVPKSLHNALKISLSWQVPPKNLDPSLLRLLSLKYLTTLMFWLLALGVILAIGSTQLRSKIIYEGENTKHLRIMKFRDRVKLQTDNTVNDFAHY